MSEFERETDQVLAFSYRKHSSGGELPCVAVRVLPADRAEQITALDERIQQLRRMMPLFIAGAVCLGIICMAAMGWMKPGLAAAAVGSYLLQTFFGRRREAEDD